MSRPRITLMCITDGRWDYLQQTIASAEEMLDWPFHYKLLVDDSGSATETCPQFDGWRYLKNPERRGLAGAIASGWEFIPPTTDYVFHLEDDFTFPAPVPIADMVQALEADSSLAQVALLRQPWSPEEQHAGSIYAMNRGVYSTSKATGVELVTHRRLFTFNPSLYPRAICDYGAGLEQEVTDALLAHGYRFSYLGGISDDPRCLHIGVRRSAGYHW